MPAEIEGVFANARKAANGELQLPDMHAMVPYLTEQWTTLAASTMRHREIYMHDRARYQLSRIVVP